MNKIDLTHLQRKALIYIRQSSMAQVRNNLESQRLQYDLEKRAKALGWKTPVIIDEDLGKSASGGHLRSGFQSLLEEVCAANVGAIFAIEASRLSRCGSEWHSLLEFCAIVGTLIIDTQTIYDPRIMDDRFLLGLKGTMSEMEVSMLRARTRSASIEKAQRGELYIHPTTGFILLPGNQLVKDPNKRVQEAVLTVFQTFEKLQTIGKTAKALRDKNIEIPTAASRDSQQSLQWRLPQYSTIRGILTNPVYGGSYVYGRTRSQAEIHDGVKVVKVKVVALEDALVVIEDHHEGYITWEQYKHNQKTLANNRNIGKDTSAKGAPRQGAAILAGLLRCGKCGCQLVTRYYGDNGKRAAYFCNRNSKIAGEKRCLFASSQQIDEQIEHKLLEVIAPLGITAALEAHNKAVREIERHEEQCQLRLEEKRYQAGRAHRQYDQSDPENRLVTAELEKRWNHTLEQVAESESELAKIREESVPLTQQQIEELNQLGEDFAKAWKHPRTAIEHKKRIARAVIEEVIVTDQVETLAILVHWKGGDHTELTIQRLASGRRTDKRAIEIINELSKSLPDKEIAIILKKEGLTTGTGLTWTAERVRRMTKKGSKGRTLTKLKLGEEQVGARLGIKPKEVRKLIQEKQLKAHRVCVSAPWLIEESELQTAATNRAVAALKRPKAQQQDLDLQSTSAPNCAL